MIIKINEDILDKYKLTKSQFYYLAHKTVKLSDSEIEDLYERKLVDNNQITNEGLQIIDKILKESTRDGDKPFLDDLAEQMIELYPKGKKQGTNQYWRCPKEELKDRIRSFFKRFGYYDADVILDATKRYVNSFNGNTALMRTLKYFIIKSTDDGKVSDLLTWIENTDEEYEPDETLI
jgi:hypothetical protein